MIKKERYISNTDYELLTKLYPHEMDKVIEKINNDYPIQYLIGNGTLNLVWNVVFYDHIIYPHERKHFYNLIKAIDKSIKFQVVNHNILQYHMHLLPLKYYTVQK